MKALILAGGSGTRFWPASRRLRPKQLLPLGGEVSFLRRTIDRLLPLLSPADLWICTGADLRAQVLEQAPEIPAPQVLGEPVGRNTAAAIAWTLSQIAPRDGQQVLISLHSDHWIEDEDEFRRQLGLAVEYVEETDQVMALGVRPRWAETGYGYLGLGEMADAQREVYAVTEFFEKPESERAEQFFTSGRHCWNSGIFVFRVQTLVDHLRRFEPSLMAAIDALDGSDEALADAYPKLPSLPIDTAVMERLESLSTLVLECGWSDIGSWQSLSKILEADDHGNTVLGRSVAIDSTDNMLFSESGTIVAIGISGLAVIQTDDAVLVIPKERSQEVRRIVEELRRRGRDDLL